MSMISVTLPDGTVNEYAAGITAGEIVMDIEGRKHDCVAASVDGIHKDFSTILEKHGVKKIDALNKKFDHNFHQAMMEIETNESEEGLVVQEIQSGYIMHDRLLRPSMVGVSKKTPKTKEKIENEEKG